MSSKPGSKAQRIESRQAWGTDRINCLILGYIKTILGYSRGNFYFQSQPGQGLRVMKEVNFVIAPDEGKYNSRQLDIRKADIYDISLTHILIIMMQWTDQLVLHYYMR